MRPSLAYKDVVDLLWEGHTIIAISPPHRYIIDSSLIRDLILACVWI